MFSDVNEITNDNTTFLLYPHQIQAIEESALKEFIQLTEVKIFPLNYEFIKEMNLNSNHGIIARGGAKIFNNNKDAAPVLLKKGDVISKFNKNISDVDSIVSITPLTVIWIKESSIDRVKSLSSVFQENL